MEVGILKVETKKRKISQISELFFRFLLKNTGFKNWQNIEILKGKNGKPYINTDFNFNISHSNNMILCAIDKNNNIGIDIEEIIEIPKDIFDIVLHKNELKLYKNITTEQFFKIWTMKEAYSKYTSKGLSENFTKIDTTSLKLKKNIVQWKESNFICTLYADNISNINVRKYTENEVIKYYD